ncbi:MAG TPA: hypothetical protein VHT50_18735 [Mycobacterium sp.]|jgi:hypothetical protein|nr:hypothetical protein [Mycobacterium sp.]
MFDAAAMYRRLRRYFPHGELVSMATAVAAYHGEPGLAHQLELMRAANGRSHHER